MSEEPLRALSAAEIETFQRDGVLCIRQAIPGRWIARVADAIERSLRNPTALGAMLSMPDKGFTNDIYMWRRDDDYRAFVFESPAARLAQQAMQARSVTFFYDQIFVKDAGTPVPTPWHHDLTFWQVEGSQICSIWLPLDPVTRASSGLEYVRGSHRWNKRFKAVSPDYNQFLLASDLEDPPDIDAHRGDYDLVNWDMEPGDVLIFHPLTLHGSSGNASTAHRRRALATRWLGDDAVYTPKPHTAPLPPEHGLTPGEPFHGAWFPQIIAPA